MKTVKDYPMSKITTLGIGGPAKEFVVVKTEEELVDTIKYAKDNRLEFLIIGGGSNLLVSDSGVDKLVIKNEVVGINLLGTNLTVKSGTPLQDLVDFTISHGFSGLQRLTGIPGSVGGAVYGNAGAYGQEIVDHIVEVKMVDPNVILTPSLSRGKNLITLSGKECGFGYRDSGFKRNQLIILEVTFALTPDNLSKLKAEAEEILSKRLEKYPKGIKCPGSFFKNLVADTLSKEILDKIPKEKITFGKLSAGYLLEEVGAKGQKLDGIEIASYHANLFINKGKGSTKAFYDLAKKYARLVKEKFGIILEPEVQLLNLPPII